MKKLISLMMVLVLMLSCIALVACGDDDEEEGGATADATAQATADATAEATAEATEEATADETAEPQTPTAAPTGGLVDLLSGAADIDCLSAEMTMSGPGMPSAITKMWLKEGNVRTETDMMGMETITIMDAEAEMMYMITGGSAMSMELPLDTGSPVEQAEAIMDYYPEEVGSDTIDGKDCTVFEYDMEGAKTKMWIWEDKGIPLRVETTTPEGMMVIEYTDIDFDCASDSMFELPEGVDVMDMGEMPGMPDMSDFDMSDLPDMPDMPVIPQQ